MGISYAHTFSFCLPSLMSHLANFILGFSGGFFSPFLSFVVMLWAALVGQRHKSPVLCFPKCSTLSCTCMGELALERCLNTSCWVHLARVQKAHQKVGSSSESIGSLRTGLAGGLQQEPSRCELLFSGQKPTLECKAPGSGHKRCQRSTESDDGGWGETVASEVVWTTWQDSGESWNASRGAEVIRYDEEPGHERQQVLSRGKNLPSCAGWNKFSCFQAVENGSELAP